MKKDLIYYGCSGTYTGCVIVQEITVNKDRYNASDHDSYPIRVTAWKITGKVSGGTVIEETVEELESKVLACVAKIEEKVMQVLKGFGDPELMSAIFKELSKLGYK